MKEKKEQTVRVFAPATVANVAVGYDVLGFALERPGDEIVAKFGGQEGLSISQIHGTSKSLPKDPEKNTATKGVLSMLKDLGEEKRPIEIEIFKKMPFGSGMGSSAASAAAGVMAVNELLERPFQKRELAKYAVLGESAADGAIHGDNVIPSLMGGMVLIRDNATCDFIQLPVPLDIVAFVIYPEIEILTKDARAVLCDKVALNTVIAQTGNIASFIASLFTSDFDLMSRSLQDHIIEPQRAKLIPHFFDLKAMAMKEGAMNYTISGAGPSMFGFARSKNIAQNACSAITDFLQKRNIRAQHYISNINQKGSYKM